MLLSCSCQGKAGGRAAGEFAPILRKSYAIVQRANPGARLRGLDSAWAQTQPDPFLEKAPVHTILSRCGASRHTMGFFGHCSQMTAGYYSTAMIRRGRGFHEEF